MDVWRGAGAPWGTGAPLAGASYSAMELSADGSELFVLDQRLLPAEETYRIACSADDAAEAIGAMVVRGAPAIGITAAYGVALAARAARGADGAGYLAALQAAGAALEATRPTAVNLAWAVRRCLGLAAAHAEESGAERAVAMAELARTIHREDVAACRAMGAIGAARIAGRRNVLTHCNAGALATGGYGTALGVIRAARPARVIATETRPYLQGARLTAWELARDGIDVTVIADNMVGHCMSRGMIDAVVVGADRIAHNGDVANKIGTYAIACLARAHGVPFYVAAPWSTVDLACPNGDAIPIEERRDDELACLGDRRVVPRGVAVYNPAFDVTPATLVSAIFTERGEHAPRDIGAMEAK